MPIINRWRQGLLVITVALFAGCATVEPLGEWRQPGFSGQIDNILVLGVTSRSTRRRVYEDQFVAALGTVGVNGTPSYQLITSTLKLSRETVEEAIRGQNLGGVLVTRIVGINEQQAYSNPDDPEHESNLYSYYDNAWQLEDTGYHRQFRNFTLETSLYDTKSRAMVWSMRSVVLDASQPRHVIEEQILLAVKSMANAGLLPTN